MKSNDPLHGITLKVILEDLINLLGYKDLFEMTGINSLGREHSQMKPVLKFARKTPWAKEKLESIYKMKLKEIEVMKAKKK